jgi:hypothetical protein
MARVLGLVLPALALLLLGAHFFRAALFPLAAVSAGSIGLLFVRRRWAATALRALLLLGTLEWLRTAWTLASYRAASGRPYLRMLAILGAVAAVTLVAAWLVGRYRASNDGSRGPV